MEGCYYQCASLSLYFVWLCILYHSIPWFPFCNDVTMVGKDGHEKELGLCPRRSELWKVTTPGSKFSFH